MSGIPGDPDSYAPARRPPSILEDPTVQAFISATQMRRHRYTERVMRWLGRPVDLETGPGLEREIV